VFILLTLVIGGAAGFASGRALAKTWSPAWQLIPSMIVLACAVRFLHFALYQEDLLSIQFYAVALVILFVAGFCGYRSMRATQMATQYSWAFEKSGLNWRPR
jgi:membrane protein YdbS with pleckstrin-like domain